MIYCNPRLKLIYYLEILLTRPACAVLFYGFCLVSFNTPDSLGSPLDPLQTSQIFFTCNQKGNKPSLKKTAREYKI